MLFAATLLGFALGAAARLVARQPPSRVPLGARLLACGGAAIGLGAILGVGVGLSAISPFELFIAVPGWLRALGLLSIATLPIALLLLTRALRAREWPPLARLHFATLATALALFATLAWNYNLVGIG